MRQEHDFLGERALPDDIYCGIGTTRLIEVAKVSGPEFPAEIPLNIVLVRRVQAVAGEIENAWSSNIASAVVRAAVLIQEGNFDMFPHLQVKPLHGGGARSLVLNVDEVLANVALELMGSKKGDYHILAPLFQLDRGTLHLETFLSAFHIALIDNLDKLMQETDSLITSLEVQQLNFLKQDTISTIQFQEVAFSTIGAEFACIQESLLRSRQQAEWFWSGLLPCWRGSHESLRMLRRLTGREFEANTAPRTDVGDFDLYIRYSAFLKSTAIAVMRFCDRMRFIIGCTKELETPKCRSGPAFNPAGREFLVPDTVSQLAFSVIGGNATIQAATGTTGDSVAAYLPLISAQLVIDTQNLALGLRLLNQSFVRELTGNPEPGAKRVADSPLKAEQLISVLGYERAIQVARIAALTGKPIRLVVKKMKLLTEEQIDRHLPHHLNDETTQQGEKLS